MSSDASSPSVRQRQVNFLRKCLSILEDQICGKNEADRVFYDSFLRILETEDTASSGRLTDCDALTPETKKKNTKTYINRIKKLANLLIENQSRLAGNLADYEIARFPLIEYVTGGGAGNESYFQITFDEPKQETSSSTLSDTNESSRSSSVTNRTDFVRYRTEQISRPPLFLRFASPLFKNRWVRGWFGLASLFLAFVILPLLSAYLYLFHPNEPYIAWIFGGVLMINLLLASPAMKIGKLITKKIALLPYIRLPLSSVCISEISKVHNDRKYATERYISVVTVSADCPICLNRYELKESILLEEVSFLDSRIIGVCLNNPVMHRFTFDKDLMSGERLPFRERH